MGSLLKMWSFTHFSLRSRHLIEIDDDVFVRERPPLEFSY